MPLGICVYKLLEHSMVFSGFAFADITVGARRLRSFGFCSSRSYPSSSTSPPRSDAFASRLDLPSSDSATGAGDPGRMIHGTSLSTFSCPSYISACPFLDFGYTCFTCCLFRGS